MDEKKKESKEGQVKRRLNADAAAVMTLEELEGRDPDCEIEGWLRRIAAMVS